MSCDPLQNENFLPSSHARVGASACNVCLQSIGMRQDKEDNNLPYQKPSEIAQSVCDDSIPKTTLSTDRLLVLGFLAGAYIAFGGILMTNVKLGTATFLGKGVANLLGGAVFSVGLMLVVLGGAELFTGNSLVLMGRLSGSISWRQLARNWTLVYLGNAFGSLALVFLMYASGLYSASASAATGGISMKEYGIQIAAAKANFGWNEADILGGWVQAFNRGILCNWLVCLAVWLAKSSEDTIGKIFACFFPIMAFVASGFEHSIANWYLIPIGYLLDGGQTISILGILGNLVFVTLGNVVGGGFFVGVLYWYVYQREQAHPKSPISVPTPKAIDTVKAQP